VIAVDPAGADGSTASAGASVGTGAGVDDVQAVVIYQLSLQLTAAHVWSFVGKYENTSEAQVLSELSSES
jgi:hypothetical protein